MARRVCRHRRRSSRETEAGDAGRRRPAGREGGGDRPAVLRQGGEGRGQESGSKPAFSIDSPWLRIAASELLLDVVNSYRERLTRLFYLDNWFTVPYPGAGQRVASQRWHRDPEDEHIVKVFVYFSDVDEEAGPFEYVRGSSAGGRYGDLWAVGRRPPLPARRRAGGRGRARGPADGHRAGRDDHPLRHRRLPPRRLRPHEAADPVDLDLPPSGPEGGEAPVHGRLPGTRRDARAPGSRGARVGARMSALRGTGAAAAATAFVPPELNEVQQAAVDALRARRHRRLRLPQPVRRGAVARRGRRRRAVHPGDGGGDAERRRAACRARTS